MKLPFDTKIVQYDINFDSMKDVNQFDILICHCNFSYGEDINKILFVKKTPRTFSFKIWPMVVHL